MQELVFIAMMSLNPVEAAEVAAEIVGRPDIAGDLKRICWRESRCKRIGVHGIDAHLSRTSWGGQKRLGHINPDCQPYTPGQWATRGAFGLNAAAHWAYMPKCYTPQSLDIPIVSAVVAARKYLKRCDGGQKNRWCPGRRRSKRK